MLLITNEDTITPQQPRATGAFSDGRSQEADPFQAARHLMPLPPLQNPHPHPHPHDPYKAYTDNAMSAEPGSGKGSMGAGAGGQYLGRSDDVRMSLLDEEDYG